MYAAHYLGAAQVAVIGVPILLYPLLALARPALFSAPLSNPYLVRDGRPWTRPAHFPGARPVSL